MRLPPAMSFFLFILLLPSVLMAAGVYEGGGILYGGDSGYLLQAPSGWVFDNESGVDDGIYCVMYPKGSTWASSDIVMYAEIGDAKEMDLAGYIRWDIAGMKKKAPGLKYVLSKPFKVNKDYSAVIADFSGLPGGNYERVIYVYAGKSVCYVVMMSKDAQLMKKHKNAPYEAVKDIAFMAVQIKK